MVAVRRQESYPTHMRHLEDPRVEHTAAAIRLRRWTLSLLATGSTRSAMPRASVDAWHLFLAAECCALPVGRALRSAGLLGAVAPDVVTALQRTEAMELQRVLAARSQLRTLDRLACDEGLRPVVLKGGAIASQDDEAVDLGDLDVLMAGAAEARHCAALLEGSGHVRNLPEAAKRHLAPRVLPGGLPVEVHLSADYGVADIPVRCEPLPGYQALRRHAGFGDVVRLLRHCVMIHPHRRGHLRDVVLLAAALRRCDARERSQLAEHPVVQADDAQRQMLALASAMMNGAEPEDAFEELVARKYHIAATRPAAAIRPVHLGAHALVFVDRPREIVRSALVQFAQPAGRPFLALPERHGVASRARLEAERLVRVPWRMLLMCAALGVRRDARRGARAALTLSAS